VLVVRFVTALAAAGLLVSAGGVQAAHISLGPSDFSVTAQWPGPVGSADFKPTCAQPTIPAPTPGSTTPPLVDIHCTASWTNQASGVTITGRASRLADGATGPFSAICDWTLSAHVAVTMSMNELRKVVGSAYDDFGATGTESCSWSMTFGSSAINGTISGNVTLGFVSGRTASFDGELNSQAVSGTGEYEKATGGGPFTQSQQITLPDPSLFPTGPVRRITAAAAGQPMHLTLRAGGASRAVIVLPGAKILLSSSKPYRLHLAAAPGSSCTATARSGGRTVALGRASDANRDGTILFGKPLARTLGRGAWALSATCKVGSRTAAARASITVS
jgi:hypothetical protein